MGPDHAYYLLDHGLGLAILADIGVNFKIKMRRVRVFQGLQHLFGYLKRKQNLPDNAVAERVEVAQFQPPPEVATAVSDAMHHYGNHEVSRLVGVQERICSDYYLVVPLLVRKHIADYLGNNAPRVRLETERAFK